MPKNLKLVAFDLDKTLAESKSSITPEIANALVELMKRFHVVIISGGDFYQFNRQLIDKLPPEYLNYKENLHLMPTSGTKYYKIENDIPKEVYAENFTEEEREKTMSELNKLIKNEGLDKLKTWGPQIEDRGTQITISVLGQQAPVEEKMKWDPTGEKKNYLKNKLNGPLSDLQVNTGGSTSIDIVHKGRDKGYGINKILELLDVEPPEAIFIGDNLKEGGNDYPVKRTGVECIETSGPNETLKLIKEILSGNM